MHTASLISGDTSSDLCFERVLQWLENCTTCHANCSTNLNVPLPARVLDVSAIDSDRTVRLYETQGEEDTYVCLSHCWGRAPLLTTTSTTLEERKAGFASSLLPQTFRDAADYVRKLGLRYIWIDALCIIQDDEDDWRRESAKMYSIYENAYLTIAATRGRGSGDGLFTTKPGRDISHSLILSKDGVDYPVYSRVPLLHGRGPLLTRGWVFQERLLSCRVLHFGETELAWECAEQTTCECSRGVDLLTVATLDKTKHHQALLSSSEASYKLSSRWRVMIYEYSRTQLTFAKDIFPALSGAAKQMQRQRGSAYLAGLWADSLALDLVWRQSDPPTATRPTPWRAPTWSWASASGKLDYSLIQRYIGGEADEPPERTHRIFVDVLEASCVPAGPDPTGELQSGRLVLSGPLCHGLVRRSETGHTGYSIEIGGEDFPFFYPDYLFDEEGPHQVASDTAVLCLKVTRLKSRSVDSTLLLVLRRAGPENPGACERIGALLQVVKKTPAQEEWPGTVLLV